MQTRRRVYGKPPYKRYKKNAYHAKYYPKDKMLETYGGLVKLPMHIWAPGQTTRIIRTRETVFSIIYNGVNSFTAAGFNFKLSDFVPSDLTALFDQYRFCAIEFKMLPRINTLNSSVTASLPAPQYIISSIDYDDSAAPASVAEVMQYSNCQTHAYDKPFIRRFRPNLAMGAYGSGVFASYANRTLQWIDAASTSVEHYGVKIASSTYSTGLNSANSPSWDVVVKAYIEFRSVR